MSLVQILQPLGLPPPSTLRPSGYKICPRATKQILCRKALLYRKYVYSYYSRHGSCGDSECLLVLLFLLLSLLHLLLAHHELTLRKFQVQF
jgi:hypothetical protein